MKVLRRAWSREAFERWADAALFESALSAACVLFLIWATVLAKQHNRILCVTATTAAVSCLMILVSWHRSYPVIRGALASERTRIALHLQTTKLLREADSARRQRLEAVIEFLERRRRQIVPILQDSLPFQRFIVDTTVVVIPGTGSPIAPIVMSHALKALGFHTVVYDDVLDIESQPEVLQLYKKYSLRNVLLVLGAGRSDQHLILSGLLAHARSVAIVSLRDLSRTGVGFVPEQLLYELPPEAHVGIKSYLQKAASLVTDGEDFDFERRRGPGAPILRY